MPAMNKPKPMPGKPGKPIYIGKPKPRPPVRPGKPINKPGKPGQLEKIKGEIEAIRKPKPGNGMVTTMPIKPNKPRPGKPQGRPLMTNKPKPRPTTKPIKPGMVKRGM